MDKLQQKLEAASGKRIRCGSVSAALLVVSAISLSSSGVFLPWWDGPSARVVLRGEEDGVAESLTLWEVRVVDGRAGTSTMSWKAVCGGGSSSARTCSIIKLARRFLVASVALGIINLAATLSAVASRRLKPRLRWFLVSAFLSLSTALLVGTVLLLAASLHSSHNLLGTGALAFSAALPSYLAASFTALYQATVAPIDTASAAAGRADNPQGRLKVQPDTACLPTATDLRAPNSRTNPLDVLDRLVLWVCKHARHGRIPVRVLEEVFDEIDANGDGLIDEEELKENLRKVSLVGPSEPIDRVMYHIAVESSGDIDRFQFVEFFQVVQEVNADRVVWRRRRKVDYFLCLSCFFLHFVLLGCLLMGSQWMQLDDPEPDTMHKVVDSIGILFVSLSALFAVVVVIAMVHLALWLHRTGRRQDLRPQHQDCPEQDDDVHILEDHLWACEGPRVAGRDSVGSSPKLPVTRIKSQDSLPGFIPDSEEDEVEWV